MTLADDMQLPTIDPSQRYWDERLETLPPERRRLLREHRLHWQVRRCWDGSAFYRARLEAAGIEPSTFGGLADWERMPILREADLPALGDWAVAPESWWVRTDEMPGRLARVITDGDVIQEADLSARAVWGPGFRPGQAISVPTWELSMLTRPEIVTGASRIGATLKPTEEAFAPEHAWPLSAPLYLRCREGDNLHWNDDHVLFEVVDPDSGQPLPGGTEGALVITDLAREGSPLLRFWMGQRTIRCSEPCLCGRTSAWTRTLTSLS